MASKNILLTQLSYRTYTIVLFVCFFIYLFYQVFITAMWWDDSAFGSVAKNIAQGKGYSAVFFDRSYLFHYGISTGPLLIFPLSLMIKIFGNQYWVPGVTVVSIVALLAFLLYRASYNFFDGFSKKIIWKFLLFILFFSIIFSNEIADYNSRPFGIWHLFLGEIPALIMFLIGALTLFDKHKTKVGMFIAGLWLSAAVNTKIIMTIGVGATGMVFLFHAWRNKYSLSWLVFLAIGLTLPQLLWESLKIYSLGINQYSSQIQDFIDQFTSLAFKSSEWTHEEGAIRGYNTPKLRTLEIVHMLGGVAVICLIPLLTCIFINNNRENTGGNCCAGIVCVMQAMFLSFVAHILWWIMFATGYPRYLFIGIIYGCIAVSLRLATTGSSKKYQLLICVSSSLFIALHLINICKHFFMEDDAYSKLTESERVNEFLISLQNTGNYAFFSCGNNFEIEYLLPGGGNFHYCGELEEFRNKNKHIKAVLVTSYNLWNDDKSEGGFITVFANQHYAHFDKIPDHLRKLCSNSMLKTTNIEVNKCD